MIYKIIPFLTVLLLVVSCGEEEVYVPKPHAFPKITFPERQYQAYNNDKSPYTFEYPAYAKMIKNKKFLGKKVPNDFWYDMFFPDFDAKLHLTYYDIKDVNHYDKLIADTYRMTNEHTQKANYIDEVPIEKDNVFTGKIFDITGPAATPLEFFLTDKDQHFFRGALYINTQAKPDSLAPIYSFLKDDVIHLINTFKWQ